MTYLICAPGCHKQQSKNHGDIWHYLFNGVNEHKYHYSVTLVLPKREVLYYKKDHGTDKLNNNIT